MVTRKPHAPHSSIGENFADAMKKFRTGFGTAEKPVVKKTTAKKTASKAVKKEPPLTRIERNHTNKDDFDKLLFVCKALTKDEKRPFTTVLHVERTRNGSRLVATDGRRLHVAETAFKIESGDYKPVVTKDVIDLKEPIAGVPFPNWVRVVPDGATKKAEIDLADTGIGKDMKETERMSQTFSAFVKKTGTQVNLRHLEDLPKTEWVIYTQKEKGKALVFKRKRDPDSTYAVIMPLLDAA